MIGTGLNPSLSSSSLPEAGPRFPSPLVMFSILQLAFVFSTLVVLFPTAYSHAIITPALGVNGTAARSDVQRPSTKAPCGNVDITQELPLSTPISVFANGTFFANVTNFNGYVIDFLFHLSIHVDLRSYGLLEERMALVRLLHS